MTPGFVISGQWTVPEAEEIGLPKMYYNVFRWYRAGWGRYLQSDPLSPILGYWYSRANPTNWVDPLGLKCEPWTGPSGWDTVTTRANHQPWHDISALTVKPGRLGLLDFLPMKYCCRTTYWNKRRYYGLQMQRTCDCGPLNPRLEDPVPQGYTIEFDQQGEDKHGCCIRRQEAVKRSGAVDVIDKWEIEECKLIFGWSCNG